MSRDQLSAARGIAWGLAFGLLGWAILVVGIYLLMRAMP